MRSTMRSVTVLAAVLVVGLLVGPEAALAAPRCFGKPATIVGTSGRNRIEGTNGSDVIVGLGGDDFIRGRGGDDFICGGRGDDILGGDGGQDKVDGQGGFDDVFGGGARDRLFGGGGAFDALLGNAGNDRLFGEGGQDILLGQGGNDRLSGGAGPFDVASFFFADGVDANLATREATGEGRDTWTGIEGLEGSRGEDMFTGTAGIDFFWEWKGNDVIDGAGNFDLVSFFHATDSITVDLPNDTASGGGLGTDTLTNIEDAVGSNLPGDVLIGDIGSNFLFGLAGGDDLTGDQGDDLLNGGNGSDTGDAGEGGEANGDVCISIETPTNCEEEISVAAPVRHSRSPGAADMMAGAMGGARTYRRSL